MKKGTARWDRLIHGFRNKTVGVYGDFMLDELLRGEATRISPEAPVPVVLMSNPDAAEGYPGGAGNVAANLAALGGRPIPWGVVGNDESSRRLLKLMEDTGIRCTTLVKEAHRMTPRKLRIVAHQHQLLRLDFEKTAAISPRSSRILMRSFSQWASRLDALIVSDYQKGSVTPGLCQRFFEQARLKGVPIFMDPKPSNADLCCKVTAVTPNLHEAERMVGFAMRTAAELDRGGRLLLEQFGCEYLLITRSSEGMALFSAGGVMHSIPSTPRPVYDVTGAGDTVIAVLALAYSAGASMIEAAQLANVAAGKVVLKFGTSPITREELLEVVAEL